MRCLVRFHKARSVGKNDSQQLIGHAGCMLSYEQLTVLQSMRLNVTQPVLDYEGKPLMVNQTNADGSVVIGEDHRPVQVPETLRSYLVLALNNKA